MEDAPKRTPGEKFIFIRGLSYFNNRERNVAWYECNMGMDRRSSYGFWAFDFYIDEKGTRYKNLPEVIAWHHISNEEQEYLQRRINYDIDRRKLLYYTQSSS